MGVDKLTTKHAQSPTKVVIIVYYLRQLTTTVYDSNADIDTPYNPKWAFHYNFVARGGGVIKLPS